MGGKKDKPTVDGGHLLLMTRRRGAAIQTPVLERRLPASAHRHKSEDWRNRCSENLLGIRMNRIRAVLAYVLPEDRPQHTEIALHERQLRHRQETTSGQLDKAGECRGGQ